MLHPSLALRVTSAKDSDGDLLGYVASDLQENIYVDSNSISGTLKYIADYSSAGYTGDEESGHFLALKITAVSGATITIEVVGGVHGAQTLDSDGLAICRIANTTQKIRIVVTKDTESVTKTYALTDLVLEA